MAEIRKTSKGERPSANSDHAVVDRKPSGRFEANGSAITGDSSVRYLKIGPFDTLEEAIAVATTWADRNGIPIVHVMDLP
jgi:hypothetical protein